MAENQIRNGQRFLVQPARWQHYRGLDETVGFQRILKRDLSSERFAQSPINLKASSAMTVADSTSRERAEFVVRRDFAAVRDLIRRVKKDARLADLALFGRRMTRRSIDEFGRRRYDHRRITLTVQLVPVAFDEIRAEPLGDDHKAVLAITKFVSQKAVAIRHGELLQAKHAIITAESRDGGLMALLMEVRWSHIGFGNTHVSGGRFVGVVETAELATIAFQRLSGCP